MRTGAREKSIESRGTTAWNDGLYSLNGAGFGDGSISETEDFGVGTGGAGREGADALSKTSWFAPVEEVSDCPGGICPVPWATKEETPVIQEDVVNHPPHYTDGGSIECIEAIESALTDEEYRGYLKGNIQKYVWREKHKGGTESLKKAQWYLDRLIQLDEAQKG
jgi:hypothetical protein